MQQKQRAGAIAVVGIVAVGNTLVTAHAVQVDAAAGVGGGIVFDQASVHHNGAAEAGVDTAAAARAFRLVAGDGSTAALVAGAVEVEVAVAVQENTAAARREGVVVVISNGPVRLGGIAFNRTAVQIQRRAVILTIIIFGIGKSGGHADGACVGFCGVVLNGTAVHLHGTTVKQLDGAAGSVRVVVLDQAAVHDDFCTFIGSDGAAALATGGANSFVAADYCAVIENQLTRTVAIDGHCNGSSTPGRIIGNDTVVNREGCLCTPECCSSDSTANANPITWIGIF